MSGARGGPGAAAGAGAEPVCALSACQQRLSYTTLSELALALLDGTVFEIVQGLLEIQHLTEKNLYSQRRQLHSEHRGTGAPGRENGLLRAPRGEHRDTGGGHRDWAAPEERGWHSREVTGTLRGKPGLGRLWGRGEVRGLPGLGCRGDSRDTGGGGTGGLGVALEGGELCGDWGGR